MFGVGSTVVGVAVGVSVGVGVVKRLSELEEAHRRKVTFIERIERAGIRGKVAQK